MWPFGVVSYRVVSCGVMRQMPHWAGKAYFDYARRIAVLPAPQLGPSVFVSLEYESKGVDVKLFDTAPSGVGIDRHACCELLLMRAQGCVRAWRGWKCQWLRR